jgi:hypothetical protein
MVAHSGLSVAAVATAVCAGGRSCRCRELERIIAERYTLGSLCLEDVLQLFDELLPRARSKLVITFNNLLIVLACPGAGSFSTVRDGPVFIVLLFNRMARVGANKVAPDMCTYSIAIDSCCHVGRLDLSFAIISKILKALFDYTKLWACLDSLLTAARLTQSAFWKSTILSAFYYSHVLVESNAA